MIIRDILFSSNENKEKIKTNNFGEKIQGILDKCDDKNKKIKLEGKILIYNINYTKKEKTEENKDKKEKLPLFNYIEKEKLVKNSMYNYMTKGILIKAPNPKGKIKEFNFCFSPDLMKIYLKKPKSGIPPKPKYTLETPLIKEVIQDYEIKSGKKLAANKQLCFGIEQELIEGQKAPKHLAIICMNENEANLIWGCVEIIVDYIKKKCGKEYKCKIDDFKKYFENVRWEQITSKHFDRKKSAFIVNKIK